MMAAGRVLLAAAFTLFLLCTSTLAFESKSDVIRAAFSGCDETKSLGECLDLLQSKSLSANRELGSSSSSSSSTPGTSNSSNSSNTTSHGDHDGHQNLHADDHLVIITLTLTMMIGALTHQFIKVTELSVPYTSAL